MKKGRTSSEMKKMRARYQKLFLKTSETKVAKTNDITEQEIEFVNQKLREIEEIIKSAKGLSRIGRREAAKDVLRSVSTIKEHQMDIEQIEQLYKLLKSDEITNVKFDRIDRIDFLVYEQRRKVINRLVKVLEAKMSQTEDIEELKMLDKRITGELVKDSQVVIETLKNKIKNKVRKLQEEKAIERNRYDISKNIETIIVDLTKGTIDISSAKAIIEKEARDRVGRKPQGKFALTEEQEKEQILRQIRIVIRDRADEYKIENPEEAVLQIKELSGGNIELAVSTVVQNLINRKDFNTANGVCDKFFAKCEDLSRKAYKRDLKNKIRYAQIGDFVLKGINMNGTEEEMEYFKLIEEGLKRNNINPKLISLGKSQDGLRDIRLSDIWEPKSQKEK